MARHKGDKQPVDITAKLQPLVDDDAFLTSLSEGVDPSDGTDDLAALLLELREDVERQMPPAPVVEGADEESAVISLGKRRSRRSANQWIAGLVGAAAATVVVAGSGAALYNATPGSPLWNVSTAVFGDRTAVVELASTLEDMQVAADNGDIESTRELLGQARLIVSGIKDPADTKPSDTSPSPRPTVTVTQTETVEVPADEPEVPAAEPVATATVTSVAPETADGDTANSAPNTVTETRVATVTVTAPARQNPLPAEQGQGQGQGQGTGTAPAEPEVPAPAPGVSVAHEGTANLQGPQGY
ncbi:hypothetical protein [Corynebacterium cystitidis]|uniref:Anti-sigma-D factor RsdA to sigma factor binding region n=1 Tax=Corynebacterium cystitidis DSM 20524 TaxID=1121357 RepID=A0A1H9QYI6_9CORY|nr:hypothetical protein [Corynebacterium cystitidis]WJY81620.1 hypothetical protein CCYS_03265 [Corynebacterium cystitidis DSM 20524]SER65315.1 hypothetical protein SAMN05661109_00706 [Corynebacterium cystitidis DSM 20524]SNV85604.1 Uncharacterised protein [Corynebacterium cystitidis]